MTPAEIALARRIIACGLPVPAHTVANGGICASWEVAPATPSVPHASTWEAELWPGDTCRPFGTTTSAGLLFRCVATGTGPKLLPVLDDFALLGWLILELESATGSTVEYMSTEDGWITLIDGEHNTISHKETRIEALVAALEAAQAAE